MTEGVRLSLSAKQKCHIAAKSRPKKSTSFVLLGFLCDMILRFKCTDALCISQNVSGELLPSALLFMRRMSQAPFGAVKRVVGGADPYLGCPRFRSAPEMPRKERTEAETFSLQSCFDVSGSISEGRIVEYPPVRRTYVRRGRISAIENGDINHSAADPWVSRGMLRQNDEVVFYTIQPNYSSPFSVCAGDAPLTPR